MTRVELNVKKSNTLPDPSISPRTITLQKKKNPVARGLNSKNLFSLIARQLFLYPLDVSAYGGR